MLGARPMAKGVTQICRGSRLSVLLSVRSRQQNSQESLVTKDKMTQAVTVKPRNIRLPLGIYEKLCDEAQRRGTSKPAVMARMVLVERLGGNISLDSLVNIASQKISITTADPRFSIRLNEDYAKIVDAAMEVVSPGNFSKLVQVVLIERYGS